MPASRKSKCEPVVFRSNAESSLQVNLSTRLAIVEPVVGLIDYRDALQLQALGCEAEVLTWVPPGARAWARRREASDST